MPAYHMLIKDLILAQKAEMFWYAQNYPEALLAVYHKHQHDLAALRQQHRDERARAKAEKALHDKSKVEPDFWTYFPNHEGRRDTMTAVLKSLGMPNEATELMPTYAEWLLTANKVHANGRPMNRWALMTAFAETLRAPPAHEVAPAEVEPAEVKLIL